MERKPLNIYQINLFKTKYNFGRNKIRANQMIIICLFSIIILLPLLVNYGSNLWDVVQSIFPFSMSHSN
jgi:hypothetical protein